MPTDDSATQHANQRATDEQLFAILRKAKREDGIPALVTSQFNEIGEYDYSSTGLNQRLMNLHEDGILGHQKAGNRHMWWLSGEGTTEPTELSPLVEMVDYDELDPEQFSEEKAEEIMEVVVPGFKKNWWQRVYLSGDDLFRAGGVIFLAALGIVAVDPMFLPDAIFATALSVGFLLVVWALANYSVGYLGNIFVRHAGLSEEPWGGKNLTGVVMNRVRSLLNR